MGQLKLYAVSDIAGIFRPDDALAAHLRQVALRQMRATSADAGPNPLVNQPLINKVGPLLKQPLSRPSVCPHPLPQDVERLLTGQPIHPGRLAACWQIVGYWLDDRAKTSLQIQVNGFDDLAPAGIELARLLAEPAGLPLDVPPGMRVGMATHEKVCRAVSRCRAGRIWHEQTDQLAGFLFSFADLCAASTCADEPRPDLVGVYSS